MTWGRRQSRFDKASGVEEKRLRVGAVRCLWHKNRGTTDRADRSAVLEWRQVDVVVVVGGDLLLPSTRRRRRRTVFNGETLGE